MLRHIQLKHSVDDVTQCVIDFARSKAVYIRPLRKARLFDVSYESGGTHTKRELDVDSVLYVLPYAIQAAAGGTDTPSSHGAIQDEIVAYVSTRLNKTPTDQTRPVI